MHIESGVPLIWIFLKFGHGKGEHDGVGACVKRDLVKEQFNFSRVELFDASSIVDWCNSTLS